MLHFVSELVSPLFRFRHTWTQSRSEAPSEPKIRGPELMVSSAIIDFADPSPSSASTAFSRLSFRRHCRCRRFRHPFTTSSESDFCSRTTRSTKRRVSPWFWTRSKRSRTRSNRSTSPSVARAARGSAAMTTTITMLPHKFNQFFFEENWDLGIYEHSGLFYTRIL